MLNFIRQLNLLKKLSRDKVDTLLLLLACLGIILIHANSLPNWITLCAGTLLLWRAWLTISGRQLPERWFLLAIALLLMLGIFGQFRSFFGRETGVAMLALLLACKLLEMHAKRDLFVIIFLGFFLLITSFFNSQSLGSAMQVVICALLLLTAQLAFQFAERSPSLWQQFKMVIKITALAIPLTIAAFFLFPRIQGPLWGLPSDANVARSGLSDSMSPGNISKLAMSEELVFRARFLDSAPEKAMMYWRAIILNEFDGRTWTQRNLTQTSDADDIEFYGKAIRQEITLEPTGINNLFGLDHIAQTPELDGMRANLNGLREISVQQTIRQRIRYELTSYPHFKFNKNPSARILQQALILPAGFNPLTRQFALQIRANNAIAKDRINAVLSFFRHENFFYTLEPPALGRNSIDDFLFTTKSGFCEHYASAFVFIMRAMGIPARVVTGYQGGTQNMVDGFFEIRQSDAHAWAEVWLTGEGWVRIDPTAAVAPERVLKNLNATQQNQGLSSLMNNIFTNNSWINQLRMNWSALNNSWNQWVLNYNETKQFNLMQSLGLTEFDWEKTLIVIFGIGLSILGVLAIPLLRHRPQIPPADRHYYALCKKLERRGLKRMQHESPTRFFERIQENLTAKQIQIMQQFISLYVGVKYGKPGAQKEDPKKQLKSLLKQFP